MRKLPVWTYEQFATQIPVDLLSFFAGTTQGNSYAVAPPVWSAIVTYSVGQKVTYGITSYASLTNGNLNHVPPNASYWAITTPDRYPVAAGSSAGEMYVAIDVSPPQTFIWYGSTWWPLATSGGGGGGGGGVSTVTATAPVASSGGAAPDISMAPATSIANGYMTSTYAAKLDGIEAGANYSTVQTIGAHEKAGFVNSTTSALSFNNGSRDFTLTPIGTCEVWANNVKYSYTTPQVVNVPNTIGVHFIYINSAGTLVQSTLPWGGLDSVSSSFAMVAFVYWDGTKGATVDERHGSERNRLTHQYLHNTRGATYYNGLTGTFTDTTLSIDAGAIYDEDLYFYISGPTTTVRQWHRSGIGTDMHFDDVTTPYLTVTGQMAWDNAGTLTPVSNGYYIVQWYYAIADIAIPIYVVCSQAEYADLTAARAATLPIVPMGTLREGKLIYSVIYHHQGGSEHYQEAVDYRTVQSMPNAAIDSLPAANVTFAPYDGITATNVQTAFTQVAPLTSSIADGAGVVALTFDTTNSLVGVGAKLLSLKNAGVEVFSFWANGDAYVPGYLVWDPTPARLYTRVPDSAGVTAFKMISQTVLADANARLLTLENGNGGVKLYVTKDGSLSSLGYLQAQNGYFYSAGTAQINLINYVVDGGAAIGTIINTGNTLSTTGAKLVSFTNNGAEKIYFDKDGNTVTSGGYWGTSYQNTTTAAPLNLLGNMNDGASAVGAVINSVLAWSNAGAKLLSLRNATVEKAYVAYDGSIVLNNNTGYKQRDDGGVVRTVFNTGSDGTTNWYGYHQNAALATVNGALYLWGSGPSTGPGAGNGAVVTVGYQGNFGVNTGTTVIGAGAIYLKSFKVDSGVAATIIDTGSTFSVAKLLSIQNNTAEKAYIHFDGSLGIAGYNVVNVAGDGTVNHLGYQGRNAIAGTNGITYMYGSGPSGTYVAAASYLGYFGINVNAWTDTGIHLKSFWADGASSKAITLNTNVAYVNATAKLLSIQNNSVEKFYITKDGFAVAASYDAPAVTAYLRGSMADGAAAVATVLDSQVSLSTTGAKILSVRNNNVEKFYIDKDGKTGEIVATGYGWGSVVPTFGQPTYRINELTDILYRATYRYTVTGGNAYAALFDGNFDSPTMLPPSATTVININLAGQGDVPVIGITYPEGKVYVSFYYTSNAYTAIQLRKQCNGVWTTLAAPVNISTNPSFKVMAFTVTGANYLTDLELSITTDGVNNVWVSAMNYCSDRWTTELELPYFSKYLPLNRYVGSLYLKSGTTGTIPLIVDSQSGQTEKLLSVRNDTVEKLAVDIDGVLGWPDGQTFGWASGSTGRLYALTTRADNSASADFVIDTLNLRTAGSGLLSVRNQGGDVFAVGFSGIAKANEYNSFSGNTVLANNAPDTLGSPNTNFNIITSTTALVDSLSKLVSFQNATTEVSYITAAGSNFLTMGMPPTVGAEEITNLVDRDFSGAPNWTGTGWSWTGSAWNHGVAGAQATTLALAQITNAPVVGRYYKIVASINTANTGYLAVSFGDSVSYSGLGYFYSVQDPQYGAVFTLPVATLTCTAYVLANTVTGPLIITPSSGWTGTIFSVTLASVSFGCGLSEELVTNLVDRDFSAAPNWTGTGWSLSSGTWSHTAGANATTLAAGNITGTIYVNTPYQITATIVTTTAGTLTPKFAGTSAATIPLAVGTLTDYTCVVVSIDGTGLVFTPDANWVGTIDNVSVKSIAPVVPATTIKSANMVGCEVRTAPTLQNSLGIGWMALATGSPGGDMNTAIGSRVMQYMTNGSANTGIGDRAMVKSTTAKFNVAVGSLAMNATTIGVRDTAVGYQALASQIQANDNTAIGAYSSVLLTSGINNVTIGSWAGYGTGSGALTTGSNNIYIGYQAVGSAGTVTNEMAIGYQAVGLGSNTTVIGNSSTTTTTLWGAVKADSYNARTATSAILKGAFADGASAVGAVIDNSITLANATAKLLSVRNNTVEKASLDTEGRLTHGITWDDMQGPAQAAQAGPSVPTYEAYRDTPAILTFFKHNQDEDLTFTYQTSHRWVRDTEVRVHIHYIPMVTPAVDEVVRIEYSYAWAHANTELPAATGWTTSFTDITIPASGADTFNEKLAGLFNTTPTGSKESSILIVNVKRLASSTSDTYTTGKSGGTAAANFCVLSVDAHFQSNKEGTIDAIPT